jgi:hypothetical protein
MLIPSLNKKWDHVFGCQFAPLQIVAYGSFQCRVSAAAYAEVRLLQEIMGSQLLYAYRHYPDPFLHPLSLDAAIAAEVAGMQGKFWNMMAQKVTLDFGSGVKSGVRKTPAFFINGIRFNERADFNGLYKACRYTLLIREAELKQSTQN